MREVNIISGAMPQIVLMYLVKDLLFDTGHQCLHYGCNYGLQEPNEDSPGDDFLSHSTGHHPAKSDQHHQWSKPKVNLQYQWEVRLKFQCAWQIQWTPSNLATLGTCQNVLIRGVASFQGEFSLRSILVKVAQYRGVASFQGFRLESSL